MKIEKITKQKSGKYKLLFDDDSTLITYDEVVLNHNLLFHKEIDSETLHQIEYDTNYYQLLNEAIKHITKRLRSELEVKTYLEKRTSDLYLIDDIIGNLKQKNYIDDYRFAKSYINDKLNFNNLGLLRIKNDLLHLGIDEDIIEKTINKKDFSCNNKLEKIIDKKIKSNHKYSSFYLKQKIVNDLINMGYEREEIIRILDTYYIDDSIMKDKEYKRLYRKLQVKYQGKELEYQINKMLKLKGFK